VLWHGTDLHFTPVENTVEQSLTRLKVKNFRLVNSDFPRADFHKTYTANLFDAGLLHRGISAVNIMITDE
jgi:hypothetical protein